MTIRNNSRVRLAGLGVLVCSLTVFVVLTSGATLFAQGMQNHCAEIHNAVAKAGIPVESVRCRDGQYEVVLKAGCTDAQKLEAARIRDEILASPAKPIVVDNLQDALVVLQFEPMNESARTLVRARYDELKQQAKSQ